MSLLTKYRPQKFSEVIGQDLVVRSLQAALKEKRGKVFLFTGPPGTGKTTLARLSAEFLGCSEFEVTEVDAATYTGIDDIRALTSSLAYRPLDHSSKALIIDEAHALSRQAFQAMLKNLEEPPEWAYWFLCTTEPGKLPSTIVSRSLRYDLKALDVRVLGDLYDRVCEAEDLMLPGDVGDLVIREAHGSPRQLLANLAVCMGAKSRREAAELLKTAEGSTVAFNLAQALYRGAKWPEVKRLIAEMGDVNAESVRQVVLAYGRKILEGDGSEKRDGGALEVLSCFEEPYNSMSGTIPVWMSCARLLLSKPSD